MTKPDAEDLWALIAMLKAAVQGLLLAPDDPSILDAARSAIYLTGYAQDAAGVDDSQPEATGSHRSDSVPPGAPALN